MFKRFKPDYFLDHYSQIDTKWMNENGFKTILSDLDDTLVKHDAPFDEEFANWYNQLEKDGFALIIASNNSQQRVDDFTSPFSIVGYGKCHKPQTKKLEKNLFYKGLDPNTTLFLGDQLFTDMWCGHRLGIKKALVCSLTEKETHIVMKVKRFFEKAICKHWESS